MTAQPTRLPSPALILEQDDLCLPATWQGDTDPVPGQPIELAFEVHTDDEGPFTLLAWRPV